MPKKQFSLNISATEYQKYYGGTAQAVVTTAVDGRQIQFPASELRRFVTHSGVHGWFEITYTNANKLISLEKLD